MTLAECCAGQVLKIERSMDIKVSDSKTHKTKWLANISKTFHVNWVCCLKTIIPALERLKPRELLQVQSQLGPQGKTLLQKNYWNALKVD